jgi:hypothetical protein
LREQELGRGNASGWADLLGCLGKEEKGSGLGWVDCWADWVGNWVFYWAGFFSGFLLSFPFSISNTTRIYFEF